MIVPTKVPHVQAVAMAKLEKQGFRFGNWISPHRIESGGEVDEDEEIVTDAVMIKKTKFGREYREVSPEGLVNGEAI
jgi:hypothetical protein